MKENQLSIVLAVVCGIVSIYIAFLMLSDINAVYKNAVEWSGSLLQAGAFTAFIASGLLSSLAITILIYVRSRSWLIILLSAHVAFVVVAWPAYLELLSVMVWWLSKYVYDKS